MAEASQSSFATRSSRSSSFWSQVSGSTNQLNRDSSNVHEKSFGRRQQQPKPTKWTSTIQAAAAALSGRGTGGEATSVRPARPDSSNSTRSRKDTLYFGRDISTSMWWRFRRGGEDEDTRRFIDKSDEAPPRYENSFRMDPQPGCKFQPERVEEIMTKVLEDEFTRVTYRPENGPEIVKRLADNIKTRVKLLQYERYRLVVLIQVGQIEGLEMMINNRCVWNTETDCYATATFQNGYIYAIATTYGIYLD
ncbi:tctex1 domain-containing protein 1-like [Asterias rubens]|uniref:tctex1 domain-containing protein 1-like n=1 Tax=Asterias rubens TaxID=7604 RepID=UPI0014558E43|nr:tctex1 domain-containing protein 1-like [Asterias rubens]